MPIDPYEEGALSWRTQEEHEKHLQEREATESYRDQLADRIVSVNLALHMRIGEEATERLVDDLWEPMRAGLENPETREIILALALEACQPLAGRRLTKVMHSYGLCACHGN